MAGPFVWADVILAQQSDAAAINALGNAVEAHEVPWTDYSASFAIQATTTNATIGNSDVKARYKQIGKIVIYGFWISLGSTFTPGSGNWRFPLPVPALTGTFATITGSAFILDNGTAQRAAMVYNVTAALLEMMLTPNNALIGSTGSGTAWAATDLISGCVSYEAA